MPKKDVTLQCQTCGATTNRPAYCPYTGHRHSNGWKYKCKCSGEMIEVAYRPGGACAFTVPEPGEPWLTVKEIATGQDRSKSQILYLIQILRYTDQLWTTRVTATREGVARLVFESMLKFKNYGDQIRIRKINTKDTYNGVTIHES